MRATFRQIETFLLVHHEGSFAAAAKRIGVSQAAISKQIAALERAVGGEVFERCTGARAKLNSRGRLLVEQAPEILQRAQLLGHEPQLAMKPPVKIRIAADEVLLLTVFNPHLSDFCRTHPHIQIELTECEGTLDTIADMKVHHIDLAYFAFFNTEPPSGKLLATSLSSLYISPHFSEARTWHNDSKEPLPVILHLSGSAIERSMRGTLANAGVTNYRVVAHVQRRDAMRELAIEGMGACFSNKRAAAPAVEAGQLIELSHLVPEHVRRRYVFRNPQSVSTFVDIVENYFSSLIRELENTNT